MRKYARKQASLQFRQLYPISREIPSGLMTPGHAFCYSFRVDLLRYLNLLLLDLLINLDLEFLICTSSLLVILSSSPRSSTSSAYVSSYPSSSISSIPSPIRIGLMIKKEKSCLSITLAFLSIISSAAYTRNRLHLPHCLCVVTQTSSLFSSFVYSDISPSVRFYLSLASFSLLFSYFLLSLLSLSLLTFCLLPTYPFSLFPPPSLLFPCPTPSSSHSSSSPYSLFPYLFLLLPLLFLLSLLPTSSYLFLLLLPHPPPALTRL